MYIHTFLSTHSANSIRSLVLSREHCSTVGA